MPKSSHLLALPTHRWLELYGRSVPLSNRSSRSSRSRDPKFKDSLLNTTRYLLRVAASFRPELH
jgi:hypothetical protein